MANATLGDWNATTAFNATDFNATSFNNTMGPSVSSILADAAELAKGSLPHINASAVSFNSSGANDTVWDVEHDAATANIICYALIAIFFSFFVAIVVIDMHRKYVAGELKEDFQSLCNLLCKLVKGVPKLFIKLTSKNTWLGLIRLFKKEKNTKEDLESASVSDLETKATIERLAAKPARTMTEKVDANNATTATAAATAAVIESAVQTGDESTDNPEGTRSRASSLYSIDLDIDPSIIV